MPKKNLDEIAREIFEKLKNAEEKYVQIQNKKEKIIEMEIINIKELKATSPRFKLTTEEGTVLILTPSQFLRRKYIIVENGKEKRIVGV